LTDESKSAVALAIEAQARWHREVELGDFLNHDKTPVGRVAIVVNSKRDDIAAQREAHAKFEQLAKEHQLGQGTFREDETILDDLKNAFAIFKAFRRVDDITQNAFPAAEWVAEHLDNDQIGTLVRLYNQSRAVKGPAPWDITPDWIRAVRDACAAYAEQDERPEQPLANFSRAYLDDFLSAAMVLWTQDTALLVAENARLRAEVAAKKDTTDEDPQPTEEPGADDGEPGA
jgi:hypothetical protein